MLVLAENLFRLDVVISDDTIRTIVRNLSSGELSINQGRGGAAVQAVAVGEADAYRPGHSRLEFTLGEPGDRVGVTVLIGTLRLLDRGTVRVSAQAIVRHASTP